MTTAQNVSTVQDRIESIHNKAEQVAELAEEADQIKAKRERAQAKNNGFESLESKLDDVEEQYGKLKTWVQIAGCLNVSVERDELRAVIEEIDGDIGSFLERDYEGFYNRSDVDDEAASFEHHRETLRGFTDEVKRDVQSVAQQEAKSVDRIQSLLQIPDIGTDEDKQVCDNYQYFLGQISKGNMHQITIERLSQHRDDFHSLDISLGTDLSEEARDVIWSILEDKEVTLAEVSSDVLADLKSFEEFSQRLTVEFTRST
ncbi:hypothetical protein [Salinigranum halophilum]|uniref:hypothetical protein n=1 Tax=Salinigranum halophilum TaxID=2565931 RepID=UPI00115C9255|nr:hypothetical protein [Salinigranum halophilum]